MSLDPVVLRYHYTHKNVFAFCGAIDLGEHGPRADSEEKYREMFGGELFDAPPWVHPHRKINAGGITSTAAGRGQFLAGTWDEIAGKWGLPDFSPDSQDLAMVALIMRRGAIEDVIEGRIEDAVRKCAHEWASLPFSPYGQPTVTLEAFLARYESLGGAIGSPATQPLTEPAADQQEAQSVDPITALSLISTIGPQIVGLIPQVKKLFAPDVPVAERNVGAAVAVLDTIVKTAQAPDVHAAIATMKADPQVRDDVIKAVVTNPEVVGLLEIGGGVVAARKANAEASQAPLSRDRAFVFGMVFMVAVFMLLADFLFVHPTNYDGNLRTQIVTAVLALAAVVGAYFFGTSQGSQRKTDLIANKE